MKQKMIARSRMMYGTRRLVAGDEFEATRAHARVLSAIGKARAAKAAPKPPAVPEHDEMTLLRAEYERVVGKRPFMGWDEAKMREKIAEAKAS